MTDSIISIQSDDIIENMDHILQESMIYQTNSNIETLKCYIFYNEGPSLLNFKKTELDIYENKVSKKELLALVLKNNKLQSKKFDLTGIYKYELDLQDKSIQEFCKAQENYSFLTQYRNIEDIQFHPGIELLNDNNALILLFSRTPRTNPDSLKASKKTSKANNKTQKKVKFKDEVETPKMNKTMKNMNNEDINEDNNQDNNEDNNQDNNQDNNK